MAAITHRVGLGRNLTASEVDANFDALNTELGTVTGLTVQDEGVALASTATTLNFVGAGVTATTAGGVKTITIPGGITVQDEGSPLTTTATTLNFVGTGIDATGSGSTKTITVSAGGDALRASPLSQFAATTSAQLAGVISDETGSGALVFAVSPALTSIPTAPTAAAATNTTQIATTAHVFAERTNTATLTNKTLTAPVISTISNTGTVTLPTATDTLVGKATTDTLTNKTFDTGGTGNSFSINGLAATANTGTGAVARATSPTLVTPTLGVATVTSVNKVAITAPATSATLALVDGTTVTGPSASGTIVIERASVSLTSTNTLTQASHFNRHLTWTGSSTAAQAISATATAGDLVELTNDGSALVTFTGITPLVGFKAECQPGETFQAVYSNGAWVSLTPNSHYLIPQNSKSAAYTTVMTDAGKHIFHPSADTTARTFTIDSNANVAYPIGTALTFINQHSGGVVTISITSDTMRLASAGTTGSRTLAADGVATAIKVTSTEWIISGTGLT